MTITTTTTDELAAAFTEWDRRYREEPERFESEAVHLLKGTAETYGEACAPYLLSILAELDRPPADGFRIPQVFGSEGVDRWWLAGHVDPALAILAVTLDELLNVGPDEAIDFLAPARRYDYGRATVREATHAERLSWAAHMVGGCVSHYWARMDPDNDDLMLPCDQGDDGAEAWTEVCGG